MSDFIAPDFDKAFAALEQDEGGWCNVPGDSGGETYKGVSRNNWPAEPVWPLIDAYKGRVGSDVRALNAALAADPEVQRFIKEFYRREFWLAVRGPELDHRVAYELFDTAVNGGVASAVRMLQDVLDLFNTGPRGEKLWPDLPGHTGNFRELTMAGLRAFAARDGWGFVAKVLNLRQAERYFGLMRAKDSQEKFARGWIRARVLEQMEALA